jgi:hypothetical protein
MLKYHLSPHKLKLLEKIIGDPYILFEYPVKCSLLVNTFHNQKNKDLNFKILKTPVEKSFINDDLFLGYQRSFASSIVMSVSTFREI